MSARSLAVNDLVKSVYSDQVVYESNTDFRRNRGDNVSGETLPSAVVT